MNQQQNNENETESQGNNVKEEANKFNDNQNEVIWEDENKHENESE